MKTSEILKAAKERIGTPDLWCKELGDYWLNTAPCCAYGAVLSVCDRRRAVEVVEFLHQQVPDRPEYRHSPKLDPAIGVYNDHPDTTHADIMALLDRAIAEREAACD